jgi:hypothetical protein
LVDTPGQCAVEVARRYYEAIKTFGDEAGPNYLHVQRSGSRDIPRPLGYRDVGLRYPPHRKIVAGNKIDLVEELGYMTEGEDAVKLLNAARIYYVSALKDDPRNSSP